MKDSMGTIEVCESRLRTAMLAGDVEALDALICDDLVFTGPMGTLLTKAEDLAAHQQGILRLTRLDLFDTAFHPIEGMVLTTTKARLEGSFRGTKIAGLFAYTRLWSRSELGWRIKAGHCAMIGPLE